MTKNVDDMAIDCHGFGNDGETLKRSCAYAVVTDDVAVMAAAENLVLINITVTLFMKQ
jgi:hypothetical protein